MAEPLLSIDGLVAGYGEGTVLDGVGLAIAAGEAVALLGRNGVGKTTLLKTVMGLIRPRAGRIRLSGGDIAGLPPFRVARLGIGYVPQGREVFADLTVEENLIAGNLAAPDAAEAYGLFPALADKRNEPAGRLSGGQQQQLAIARALMAHPRLLLLDEPTEGIQPSVVGALTETLRQVARARGLAILLVEQNIDMALDLADRALFLDHGHIVADHPAGRLRAEPGLVDTAMGF